MIKSCLTLFAFCFVVAAIAQSEINVGDTVLLSGHHIVKVAGNTTKYRGHTIIEYMNQKQLFERNNKLALQEAWHEARKKEALDYTEQNEKGGSVICSIERGSSESADPKWFTIVIKKKDTELLRKRFTGEGHPVPLDNGYWRIVKNTPLPSSILCPFDVYVIDAVQDVIQFRVLD